MLVVGTFVGTLFVGTLLGLRYKVLVLVPFILAACAIIIVGPALKVVVLAILATAVLQISYLLGVVIRVWTNAQSVGSKETAPRALA